MKKEYVKPETSVYFIKVQCQILAMSNMADAISEEEEYEMGDYVDDGHYNVW